RREGSSALARAERRPAVLLELWADVAEQDARASTAAAGGRRRSFSGGVSRRHGPQPRALVRVVPAETRRVALSCTHRPRPGLVTWPRCGRLRTSEEVQRCSLERSSWRDRSPRSRAAVEAPPAAL